MNSQLSTSSQQQPFGCNTCQARFTRQENLRRHELLHETEGRLVCHICGVSCSRRDLLQRHVKRKHPDLPSPSTTRPSISRSHRHHSSTSTRAQDDELFPDGGELVEPSSFSTTHSFAYSFDSISPGFRTSELKQLSLRRTPSESYEPFFDHVALWLPIVHEATFDSDDTPEHLVLAMACLGHAAGPAQEPGLALDCYREAAMLVEAIEPGDLTNALQLAQSLLMLEIYAILYAASEALSAAGLRHHHRLVVLIRSAGLLRPPAGTTASDLDAVWQDFLHKESCKRTVLAIHQMDAMWYHLLSVPRSLSHLEIKYEMPIEEWTAKTAADWAYRRLTTQPSKPATYLDAIQLCTSGEARELTDAFGMVNITHFVLSSIREVSGWTTITNQVSMDRVEPLRAALAALETHKHKSLSFEATWRIAMVEFHMWSISHTRGVVHTSIESALRYSTTLAAAGNLIFSIDIMEAITPHVEWFLQFLDGSAKDDPPWVLLFAYQVFLWSWQCLQQGLPSVFAAVVDGGSALAWAKTAFGQRQGTTAKTILGCLDILSDARDGDLARSATDSVASWSDYAQANAIVDGRASDVLSTPAGG